MSPPPIKAVLDATAIVQYAHGNVGVGELIREIADEHAGFAIPTLCLIEAGAVLDSDQWPTVDVLLGHPQCVQVEWPAGWRDVAAATRSFGTPGRAAAVLWAVARGAYLLTGEPAAYGDPDFAIAV